MALTETRSKVKLKNKTQINGNKSIQRESCDDNTVDEKVWYLVFTAITVLSFGTRLYKISEPNHVWYVWMYVSSDSLVKNYSSGVSVGMRHILAKWAVGISTIRSFSMCTRPWARYLSEYSLTAISSWIVLKLDANRFGRLYDRI